MQRHHKEFSWLEKEGKKPKGKAPLEKESREALGFERKMMSREWAEIRWETMILVGELQIPL